MMFIGIILLVIQIVKINANGSENNERIVYRYIPRTFDEEQKDPIPVSEIFETLFSQPSPWVGSIKSYDKRKVEDINKYFITQN